MLRPPSSAAPPSGSTGHGDATDGDTTCAPSLLSSVESSLSPASAVIFRIAALGGAARVAPLLLMITVVLVVLVAAVVI